MGCRQLWVWWQVGLRVNSRPGQTCLRSGGQFWGLSDNILSWGKSPHVLDIRLTKPQRGEQNWLPVCSYSSKSSQESTVPRGAGWAESGAVPRQDCPLSSEGTAPSFVVEGTLEHCLGSAEMKSEAPWVPLAHHWEPCLNYLIQT